MPHRPRAFFPPSKTYIYANSPNNSQTVKTKTWAHNSSLVNPYLSSAGNLSKLELCYKDLAIFLILSMGWKCLLLALIANDPEGFCMFINVWAAKLSIGNTDDQQQRHLCSLSSFIHLYEKINIVRACLVINSFDATVATWWFGFCQTINWKYGWSTAAASVFFVQFYSSSWED